MSTKNLQRKHTLYGLTTTFSLLCFFTCGQALADVTTLSIDRGAYHKDSSLFGTFKVPTQSTQMQALRNDLLGGDGTDVEDYTRNYHVFDLSALTGTITGATMEFEFPSNGYNSAAASETVTYWDVSTSDADLAAGDAGSDPNLVFPDLGGGTSYGGALTVTAADQGFAVTTVALNAAALADLNAAVGIGTWAVGGDISTNDFASLVGVRERVFRGTGPGTARAKLILTGTIAPEPTAFALLALGTAGLGLVPRRRRE